MSQTTLAEVRRDERFEGYLLVRAAERRAAASGKYYLDMTLSDKTGSINAKMWDGTVPPPAPGSVALIRATGNEFNGRMQLRVERIRPVAEGEEVDMSALIPCAPERPQVMRDIVQNAAEAITDADIRAIVLELLQNAGDALLTFPAAKQMHHAERSGLLHHMTGMLRAAQALEEVYPFLNPDLLNAGVIIHDLAKISEMNADALGMVQDYTTEGKLIGHIVRGVVDIQRAGERVGAAPDKVLLLAHMVLSHHGIPEFGSPVAPKFPEAEVLHTLDTLDARMNEMIEALRRTLPGGFSEKVWAMDNRQLYRIPDAQID
jgi:3'-5' exoribonuclease